MNQEYHLPVYSAGVFHPLARIPGSQLLFIGPRICAHHGIHLTMQTLKDRISFLCFTDGEVASGLYLKHIVKAAGIIGTRRRPDVLFLIASCQNAILGTDFEILCKKAGDACGCPCMSLLINRLNMYSRHRFPIFSRPVEELLYAPLKKRNRDPYLSVNLLAPGPCSLQGECIPFLKNAGVTAIRTPDTCSSFSDYLAMAGSHLNLVLSASSLPAARWMEEKLSIPYLCLDASYEPEKLAGQYRKLAAFFHVSAENLIAASKQKAVSLLDDIRKSGVSLTLHAEGSGGGLKFSALLLRHQIPVRTLYLDRFSDSADPLRDELMQNFPDFTVYQETHEIDGEQIPCSVLREPAASVPFLSGYEGLLQCLSSLAGCLHKEVL